MSAPWLDDEPIPPWRPPRDPPPQFKATQIMTSFEDTSGAQVQMKTHSRPGWAQPLFQMNDTVEVLEGTVPHSSMPGVLDENWVPATVLQATPGTKANTKDGTAASTTYVLLSRGKHLRHVPATNIRSPPPRKNKTKRNIVPKTNALPNTSTLADAASLKRRESTTSTMHCQLDIHNVSKPELGMQVGRQATFFFAVSADEVPMTASGKRVTATCGDATLTIQVVDSAAGTFRATFTPTRAGEQMLEIIVAHRQAAEGDAATHREYVSIAAGPVAHLAIKGLAEQFEAVDAVEFRLELNDKFGNLCDINSCNVRIWYGLSGQLPAEVRECCSSNSG